MIRPVCFGGVTVEQQLGIMQWPLGLAWPALDAQRLNAVCRNN